MEWGHKQVSALELKIPHKGSINQFLAFCSSKLLMPVGNSREQLTVDVEGGGDLLLSGPVGELGLVAAGVLGLHALDEQRVVAVGLLKEQVKLG